ncbi:phage major capsid protein [Cryobacterium sp. 5I3]|uniref:phage major capsid protein n=1 Tax=Cryobacterium sp. 5I3 TaxID=3048592 RepID=UPI002B2268F7|nr:phage major capsid protein [Cryobacterium sp. 5I3]MEB0200552.1 phage major capsid protein [Cryobacterium sp. 5I3]
MASIRENIKTLLDERANVWEVEGKPLADIASTREFTSEERTKFEAAEAAIGGFDVRIRALTITADQERQINEFGRQLSNDPAMRSAIETELRCVLSTREKPSSEIKFSGKEMTRALSAGTATAGGNTVPTTFLDALIIPLRNFATVLSAGATQITTGSGESITLPRLSAFGSAAQVAEATTLNGTDPSFDQLTLKSYKFGDFRGISRELAQDSVLDIEALVSQLIGQNIGIALGQKLATGTGTNQTAGIATSATVGVTGGTGVAGGATFDNLIDLFYSIPAPYRTNSAWLVADAAFAGIRKLKDSTGQYLWVPSVQVGQPDLIQGKAVYGDPYLASGLGAKSILFGDISTYWVRFVNSLLIERSEHALFGTDQVAFRGVLRADGILTDPSAVKAFTGGAS